jgi:hypothetical protein
MTSAYLDRPLRTYKQALKERKADSSLDRRLDGFMYWNVADLLCATRRVAQRYRRSQVSKE